VYTALFAPASLESGSMKIGGCGNTSISSAEAPDDQTGRLEKTDVGPMSYVS